MFLLIPDADAKKDEADAAPAETKPAETKPAETKPVETKEEEQTTVDDVENARVGELYINQVVDFPKWSCSEEKCTHKLWFALRFQYRNL